MRIILRIYCQQNEVIIAGCGGDKLILGLLSPVGPSAPSVTRGTLSPVRGSVIAGWASAEYEDSQCLRQAKSQPPFSDESSSGGIDL
ncbi:hypothetical protein [Novipirellula galeiformis]|uniref:hypothetical protein n=1 Tax=Novipirellula galeiformis TaxID=2528004 RepID=UPI0011B6C105|nr:hypothetical protein [Novipirellula galeiformis]